VSADDPVPAETDISVLETEFLGNTRQVTFGLPRAGEGYFSPDGSTIVYQAFPVDYPFYQIYVQGIDDRAGRMISTGKGRTTCAYFSPDGERILFASAHTRPDLEAAEQLARDEAAAGTRRRYQWDFDPFMEVYVQERGSEELKPLTTSEGYDAEGSYSHDGAHIVFTSTRDGDPDLFIMDADGGNVRQLTNVDGYDGGPFFSPDDKWVIFRSDRQEKDMLQIYAVSVDGEHEVQLTDNLATVNWAPYFHPDGKFIVWTRADYSRGPMFANFDLFTMDVSWTDDTFIGGESKRITFHEKADVLPVFSPDGTQLMWTSSRTEDGSSQLWMAEWLGAE
jgi:TolB protein